MQYTIDNRNQNKRLDVFLSEEIKEHTRSFFKNLIDKGEVLLNGKKVKSGETLKAGDCVELDIRPPQPLSVKPVNLPLDIVYQDGYLAVINKAQGVTVHAGSGTGDETLVNSLLYHIKDLSGINGVIRPGIVHRLDKNTSGLMVVAKNDKAHVSLAKQISEKTCERVYTALLEGVLKEDSGVIKTYIYRSRKDRKKMAVTDGGRLAVSEFKVIRRFKDFTLASFKLQTGRTHQIRVHAKHINHSVVGDTVYGGKKQKFNLSGQLLHSSSLKFTHPVTGETMKFECGLPEYFEEILEKLK